MPHRGFRGYTYLIQRVTQMRGTIVKFDSGRRFGFIRSSAAKDDIFFHADAVVAGRDHIAPGATVTFETARGDKGPKAVNVVVTHPPPSSPYTVFAVAVVFLTVCIATLLVLYAGWSLGMALLGGINAALFCACGFDKSGAGLGTTRIPEKVLYGFAALGGSLGLLLGMAFFRHKTKKARFQFVLAVILVAQLALLRLSGVLAGPP